MSKLLCSGQIRMNTAIRCRARAILCQTSQSSQYIKRSLTAPRRNFNHHASRLHQQSTTFSGGARNSILLRTSKAKQVPTQHLKRYQSIPRRTILPAPAAAVTTLDEFCDTIAAGLAAVISRRTTTTMCESSITECDQHAMVNLHSPPKHLPKSTPSSSWLRRACRMLLRFIKLTCTLAPVVAFYPILLWTNRHAITDEEKDAHVIALADSDDNTEEDRLLRWYLNMCLTCVEYSGAAIIKLFQWAGSRPDMFGHAFCSVFSRLQDDTTPHTWKHTERAMRQAYGDDWQRYIRLGEILGSGCIGQVYRGQVLRYHKSDDQMLVTTGQEQQHGQQDVAVKVLHPNVEQDIDADLDLMRFGVRALPWLPFDLMKGLKWLDMEGVVEEFADLLKEQLDLRNEAANLQRFHENFDNSKFNNSSNKDNVSVMFPELISGFAPSCDVLVESYCDGVPILEYARQHRHDRERLSRMCKTAIQAVCKMIFLDNFMHGDLHPGNVFVSRDGKNFILFDVGIVAEYTDQDHAAIVSILTSFIRMDGRKAGRLLIADSNRRLNVELDEQEEQQHAVQVEAFLDKIEDLTIQASGKDYFMEKLGTYISIICQAAATHHVKLNPSFISAALAVKVEEGIALALDPSVEIWRVASPIIIESEARRRLWGSTSPDKKKTRGEREEVQNDSKESSLLDAAIRFLTGEK